MDLVTLSQDERLDYALESVRMTDEMQDIVDQMWVCVLLPWRWPRWFRLLRRWRALRREVVARLAQSKAWRIS